MTKQHQLKEEERFAQLISLADRNGPEVDARQLSRLRAKTLAVFADVMRTHAHKNTSGTEVLGHVRRWVIPVVAGLIVVGGIALWPFGGSTPSRHVLAQASQKLQQARTLHWRKTLVDAYGSRGNRKFEHITIEEWIDLEAGRYRRKSVGSARRDDSELMNDVEIISDGEFVIGIYYSDRHAVYWRQSPLHREAHLRRQTNQFMNQTGLSDPELLKTFKKVRQDVIEGEVCDVWIGVTPAPSYGSGDRTVNAWLLLETGELRRLEIQAADQGRSMGFQRSTYDLIERNVAMPDDLFSTDFEPPEGFVMKNAKSTAEWVRFQSGGFGTGLFSVEVLFTLPDGSLIVGWANHLDEEHANQAALFEGLAVGGPLPKLPYVIVGVKTIGVDDREVRFLGAHLATTYIDGQYYEWSLFVPERSLPPAERFFGYTFRHGRVSKGPRDEGRLSNTDTRGSFVIKSDDEFSRFVLGAMAEYSDDATAPAHVTAERVRQLADQIRQSTP